MPADARWTDDYGAWRALLADRALPAVVVDLDALDRNLSLLLDRLHGAGGGRPLTLRPATKSLRVPAVMAHIAELALGRLRGWMTFSAHETVALARATKLDDLLLAYPPSRPDECRALAELAADGVTLHVAVDHPDHVVPLAEAARAAGTELGLCLDVDVSYRPLRRGPFDVHLGVRRSPVRGAAAARALGRVVGRTKGVRLGAVLAYEAQVAGLPDRTPGSRALDPVRQLVKRRSERLAADRRRAIVEALRADGHAVTIVNGGGTGSIASTARDGSVTEVAAGSGLYTPHSFDRFDGLPLEPAAFFALSVCRRSDPDHVTCAGGGYVASGGAGPSRLPIVHRPRGLRPVVMEGFGEVQTPFRLDPALAPTLRLGDPVIARHAKAGELMERFDRVLLARAGRVVGEAETYRGHGWAFF